MTLTQAATWTRKTIIILILLIFTAIAGSVGYNIWYQHYLSTLPPVEEKPEVKFGVLPEIQFPPSGVSSSNYSYSVDTVTGGFPKFPKLIKVYFIPRAGVSLLAPERARQQAEKLGFTIGPEILSDTQHKYSDNREGELIMDLTTGNFFFQRPATSSAFTAESSTFYDQPQVVEMFKNYLRNKNLLNNFLANGRSNVTFNDDPPAEYSTADVSIWPTDIDKLPLVTAAFKHGLVEATVTKASEEKERFIRVNYTFWPIDDTTYSTYPLKTAEQGFDNLKSGQGFIAIQPEQAQISISSVSLAYFQPDEYSPYLQPVYVFEGPDFAALVPAVLKEY
ncbi:MAG: hypothetical protein C4584_00425 [Armatimonadetes bacterium]|nr:MAG: hypothetical protein C4584_00425 [Armatimonadota bacterium]